MFYSISRKFHTRSLVAVLFGVMLLALSSVCSFAQSSTASLNGSVRDKTGAVIPGATVVLLQTETNFTSDTVSKEDGYFGFSTVPVGPYSLRVTKDGFATFEQTGIVLSVGQSATFQVALSVGSSSQEVVVTASAPPVDSTDNTIQTVVDTAVVAGLPLNGRNPAALVYTAPGVTDALINPKGTNANVSVAPNSALLNESAPTSNGVRPGGTYFSLDGATNVDPKRGSRGTISESRCHAGILCCHWLIRRSLCLCAGWSSEYRYEIGHQ